MSNSILKLYRNRQFTKQIKNPDQKPKHCEHDNNSFKYTDLLLSQFLGTLKINPYFKIRVSPIAAISRNKSVMKQLFSLLG